MRVDGIVFADDRLMEDLREDQALEQVANVACLPGIVGASLAMPDIHWGYGFPIGGVAAMDADEGVVSPGRRRLRHQLRRAAAAHRSEPRRAGAAAAGARRRRSIGNVPTGVGRGRRDLRLGRRELAAVLRDGAAWAVERGLGEPSATSSTSRRAAASPGAEPELVSRAGAASAAPASSAPWARATTSSRSSSSTRSSTRRRRAPSACGGAGHRHASTPARGASATRSARLTSRSCCGRPAKYGIELPDRQLCCAPLALAGGQALPAAPWRRRPTSPSPTAR